jgi:hypothetical protein
MSKVKYSTVGSGMKLPEEITASGVVVETVKTADCDNGWPWQAAATNPTKSKPMGIRT